MSESAPLFCSYCRKPCKHRCGKCKVTTYCSKECQLAHFPNHKTFCKTLAAHNKSPTPQSDLRCTLSSIAYLPERFASNPWPCSPSTSPILALEQIIIVYSVYALAFAQASIISAISPVLYVQRQGNTLNVVSLKDLGKELSSSRYIRYKEFNKTSPSKSPSSNPEDVQTAYLGLSFFARSNSIICCFSRLILRSLKAHQMTYGDERIVGWAIYDGCLELDNPQLLHYNAITINDISELAIVEAKLNEGQALPHTIQTRRVVRGNQHIWLTFMTESGRIYDMDLTSCQFGSTILPFPGVVEVDLKSQSSMCLNGLCRRDNLICCSTSGFESVIERIMETEVGIANKHYAQVKAIKLAQYDTVVDSIFTAANNIAILSKDEGFEQFWNLVN